ncbi:hypothetical protein FRC17_010650 [Serendipita sp. 399]|nr:hypothetical protein FRC17_010650 [Serendipita sp. 399]
MEFINPAIWDDLTFPTTQETLDAPFDWSFETPYTNWAVPIYQPFVDVGGWPYYAQDHCVPAYLGSVDPALLNQDHNTIDSDGVDGPAEGDQRSTDTTPEAATPSTSNNEDDTDIEAPSSSSSSSESVADSDYIPSPASRASRSLIGDTSARHRYHPYKTQSRDRRAQTPLTYQRNSTDEPAGSIEPPSTTAYSYSDPTIINQQLHLLLQHLRENGLSSSPHHPRLLCPVFDCPLGGWNPFLHGSNHSLPRRKKGSFLSANEVARHVTSLHAPDEDLVCPHPGCKTQQRMNKKSEDGKSGYFSRIDVFRKHLKDFPAHRLYISEELRARRKLFPASSSSNSNSSGSTTADK